MAGGGRDEIGRNVRLVLERIGQAAQRAGRDPASVRLVAATKTVPPESVREAIDAGVRIVGENRVQEALAKMSALGADGRVAWHFIGQLQRRKARSVVGAFQLIHSVDSVALAEELDRRAREAGVRQAILLEVNVGGEASKAGFAPETLPEAVQAVERLEHVAIGGLMTVPPPTIDPEGARPYFRRMREWLEACARPGMTELSMGMSHDFDVAIEEGATLVRVGTAIFGARRG